MSKLRRAQSIVSANPTIGLSQIIDCFYLFPYFLRIWVATIACVLGYYSECTKRRSHAIVFIVIVWRIIIMIVEVKYRQWRMMSEPELNEIDEAATTVAVVGSKFNSAKARNATTMEARRIL